MTEITKITAQNKLNRQSIAGAYRLTAINTT
jgi:hypothetical protein